MKRHSIAQLSEKAAVLLQLLRRLEESDKDGMGSCITCGKVAHYTELQGGHFIQRGRLATKLERLNVWPQCPYCNQWGMKQTATIFKFADEIDNKMGDGTSRWLIEESRKVKKYTRGELEDMIADLRLKVKSALEEKNEH